MAARGGSRRRRCQRSDCRPWVSGGLQSDGTAGCCGGSLREAGLGSRRGTLEPS